MDKKNINYDKFIQIKEILTGMTYHSAHDLLKSLESDIQWSSVVMAPKADDKEPKSSET